MSNIPGESTDLPEEHDMVSISNTESKVVLDSEVARAGEMESQNPELEKVRSSYEASLSEYRAFLAELFPEEVEKHEAFFTENEKEIKQGLEWRPSEARQIEYFHHQEGKIRELIQWARTFNERFEQRNELQEKLKGLRDARQKLAGNNKKKLEDYEGQIDMEERKITSARDKIAGFEKNYASYESSQMIRHRRAVQSRRDWGGTELRHKAPLSKEEYRESLYEDIRESERRITIFKSDINSLLGGLPKLIFETEEKLEQVSEEESESRDSFYAEVEFCDLREQFYDIYHDMRDNKKFRQIYAHRLSDIFGNMRDVIHSREISFSEKARRLKKALADLKSYRIA